MYPSQFSSTFREQQRNKSKSVVFFNERRNYYKLSRNYSFFFLIEFSSIKNLVPQRGCLFCVYHGDCLSE